MKPVVVTSREDGTGTRCVDVLHLGSGGFGWVACRRDPEDGHGWRRTGPVVAGFASAEAPQADGLAAHPDCAP